MRTCNALRPALAFLPLLLAACTTLLTSEQQQQLETRIYSASYRDTFRAAREVMINEGYEIEDSDYDGGLLYVSMDLDRFTRRQKTSAVVLSFLVPPAGDAYVGRHPAAVVDLLLWPFSVIWAPWINLSHAHHARQEVTGNLTLEELASRQTRLRISLRGIERDTERYPPLIRSLQDQVERQMLLKRADHLGRTGSPRR